MGGFSVCQHMAAAVTGDGKRGLDQYWVGHLPLFFCINGSEY